MKRFLIWLILGALLLLSSCSRSRYSVNAYRLSCITPESEKLLNSAEPAISYSNNIDAFYNDDFKMSFAEDMQAFYRKIDAYAVQKHRNETMLSAEDLYRALSILDEPEKAGDISPLRQLALRTERSY